MTAWAIDIGHLHYAYRQRDGTQILKDLNLRIGPNEYLLLAGASGSGKSTLCRTFNGLIPHFYNGVLEGHIAVGGKDTRALSVADLFAHVGMVFQNPEVQLFNRSVAREIAFGLESLGTAPEIMPGRIDEVAKQLGIAHLLPRNPHHLSGGEQQLVAIASILALRPNLLVLDEPYANLDPVNVARLRQILHRIHRQGLALVVSEHRLAYTTPDVQRMAVLHQGQIELEGAPGVVLRNPVSDYGLEVPLATRLGKVLERDPLPLCIESLDPLPADRSTLQRVLPDSPAPPPNHAEVVLEVEGLAFMRRSRYLLQDISFSLKAGECIAIVGANGAGKTTLLKHLNGLYRPSQGRVRVKGLDTRSAKVSQLARHIGVAFQNPNSQFFKLSVGDEIRVGAQALACQDESWLNELIRLFQLDTVLHRPPYRLSDGEKKRVAFAAALAAKPSILALDEPTAGQDGYFKHALGGCLMDLRDRGQAVLLVTHDLAFAQQHAHLWLVLAQGKMLAAGSPAEVMADATVMHTAGLVATDAFKLLNPEQRYAP